MTKRIVVALGGNAILTDDPSAAAQQQAIQKTAQQLINFLAAGDVQLVLTHGNGPQVGNLVLQQFGEEPGNAVRYGWGDGARRNWLMAGRCLEL